ncbi:MAG: hypothetical protein IJ002_01990 [Clostridia bacterium]|nr:hypothetical protein [Clostridia bacterium]
MFHVDKGSKAANVQRTIRFTEDLFDRLVKTANENEVSFNNLVLQCCKYALDDMENEN